MHSLNRQRRNLFSVTTGSFKVASLAIPSCHHIHSLRGTTSAQASSPLPTRQPIAASENYKRTMATFQEPTRGDAQALFEGVEEKFPNKTVGDDIWYLVVLSALVGVEPEHAAHLYTYLIKKPQFSTSESRQALVRRLREVLVKNVSVQGVCKPLEALFAIGKIERPEDKDYTFSRENWQAGPDNLARGEKWLKTIYQGNLSTSTDPFKAHKDFDFISRQITYGFYLSDHSILGPIETELVTLAGIMIQNLPLETGWHLRGTRRVGVSMDDVETIQQCIEMVANYGGARMHKVPRVKDIEHEVKSND
ncbi:uncharacterized protein L3040_004027 [Drepanopeziza brunnea f. sp. 'multigermtubi']|uniref:Carboxymuconolactone decarboxylase n=1 Tax=Marssonina brunnea f. sp. multigermtubi (strain MB_m1) TaxID=1072389 RepID=K1WTG6_MARBU|nr:uncharacterized protein MBM_06350 [Drepanopeziza brunnea f. sp. 'multigermtubi' MB_m1]EKD15722.1 hypothetical protein MBM_06350 [Drepanopeziza brunnea f. sp. 'multigermtubi' MB_m1]KAJ5046802.1 hypothetical protein L3040_004027 [Drepanopeziza brunnea f. sp. 'multigermtubi']